MDTFKKAVASKVTQFCTTAEVKHCKRCGKGTPKPRFVAWECKNCKCTEWETKTKPCEEAGLPSPTRTEWETKAKPCEEAGLPSPTHVACLSNKAHDHSRHEGVAAGGSDQALGKSFSTRTQPNDGQNVERKLLRTKRGRDVTCSGDGSDEGHKGPSKLARVAPEMRRKRVRGRCPITNYSIDEKLSNRLKACSSVTKTTLQNALKNRLDWPPGKIDKSLDRDALIQVYFEALLRATEITKGDRVIYEGREGEEQVEVVGVDTTHPDGKPSYVIKFLDGRERETERQRLRHVDEE
jgi:hypothetical protein